MHDIPCFLEALVCACQFPLTQKCILGVLLQIADHFLFRKTLRSKIVLHIRDRPTTLQTEKKNYAYILVNSVDTRHSKNEFSFERLFFFPRHWTCQLKYTRFLILIFDLIIRKKYLPLDALLPPLRPRVSVLCR